MSRIFHINLVLLINKKKLEITFRDHGAMIIRHTTNVHILRVRFSFACLDFE